MGIGPTSLRQIRYWCDVDIQNQILHMDTLEKHKAQLNSKGYSQNGKSGLTRKHLPQQRGILLLDVAYNLLPTTIGVYS